MSGKTTIVGVVPTTTWETAAALGAGDGLLPIDSPWGQKGSVVFDDATGQTNKTYYTLIMDEANPSFLFECRWDSAIWCFLANLFGDDTKTGASPYVHTFNWQDDPALVGLTVAGYLSGSTIHEYPSLKVESISFEPADGFWNMNVSTLGDTILTGGNATNTATEFGNITYPTRAQRMRYKANALYVNAQSGGDPVSGSALTDVYDMAITIAREFDGNDDVLKNASTGTERRRAEPLVTGFPNITFGFSQKTADLSTHIDDLHSGNEFKADIVMAETVGGNSYSNAIEMSLLVPVDPELNISRGQRIPMTYNFECAAPAAVPTGHSTSNPIHWILTNNHNVTYETNA